MPRIPTFATNRLVLRPPSPGDLDDLIALFGDLEVMHFVGQGRALPTVQVANMLEGALSEARHGSSNPKAMDGLPGWLVVVRPDTQEFVGLGVMRLLAPDLAAAIGDCPELAVEVGYILTKTSWGQGFATEVARSLVAASVSLVGKDHVVAVADVGNEISHRVLEKAGFIRQHEYDYRDMRMNYWKLP